MTSIEKKRALAFLGTCVLMSALLAASLSRLDLQPGLPSPLLEGYHIIVPASPQSSAIDLSIFTLILRLLGVIVVLYLLTLLYRIIMRIRSTTRSRIWREFILILGGFVLFVLALLLFRKIPVQHAAINTTTPPSVPAFAPAFDSPPTSLIWLVGISLAVLVAFLLIAWVRARRKPAEAEALAEKAEIARRNILAGINLDEVILHCYQEMESVIQRERAIERQLYTTPGEFETQLSAAGLPRSPLHGLTRLFESVRYGHHTPTAADERVALDNLQMIISHLREMQGRP